MYFGCKKNFIKFFLGHFWPFFGLFWPFLVVFFAVLSRFKASFDRLGMVYIYYDQIHNLKGCQKVPKIILATFGAFLTIFGSFLVVFWPF